MHLFKTDLLSCVTRMFGLCCCRHSHCGSPVCNDRSMSVHLYWTNNQNNIAMGSLPNLHELCTKEESQIPQLPHKLPHYQAHQHDKTKIMLGKLSGGHVKVQKSKSNGNTTHVWDDMMLEVRFLDPSYTCFHFLYWKHSNLDSK